MSYWRVVDMFRLPEEAGCYVVRLLDGRLYVGSSVNVKKYRYSHRHWIKRLGGAEWVKFKRSRRAGDWLMEEYRLINRLRKKENLLLNLKGAQGSEPKGLLQSRSVNNYITKEAVKLKEFNDVGNDILDLLGVRMPEVPLRLTPEDVWATTVQPLSRDEKPAKAVKKGRSLTGH